MVKIKDIRADSVNLFTARAAKWREGGAHPCSNTLKYCDHDLILIFPYQHNMGYWLSIGAVPRVQKLLLMDPI